MAKEVDEYVLSIDDVKGFKTVVLKLKLTDGSVEEFAFPPSYAHMLSDELCITAVRAAGKSTGEAVAAPGASDGA